MGTVNIVFAKVGGKNESAYSGGVLSAENVTSSSTSAQSAATPLDGAVRVAPIDTDVYVKTGANPTATAGGDWYIIAGSSLDLFVNAGDKVAVIDA